MRRRERDFFLQCMSIVMSLFIRLATECRKCLLVVGFSLTEDPTIKQCNTGRALKKCLPNEILHSKSNSCSFNNGEGQSEETGKLEIRFTKSRSHASDADLYWENGKFEVPFARPQNSISDTDSSEKNGKLEIPLTRSQSCI